MAPNSYKTAVEAWSVSNAVIRFSAAVALLLLALQLQGCAAARMDRHLKQAVVVLQERHDADSLAVAAMLIPIGRAKPDDEAALALIERAAILAPERADLAWLEIQICGDVHTCNAEPAELRLRTLDPDNGASWLPAAARAIKSDNEAAKELVLTGMAGAARVDIYWTTLIVRLTRALADTRKITLDKALILVIGVLSAEAIPAYSATFSLCKGERLNDVEVLERCRRVAAAFERGDTVITEMVGLAIAQRVWAVDSPQWKAAAEQRRITRYRMQIGSALEVKSGSGNRRAQTYLTLYEQNRREQDVLQAQIIQAGESPNPPADWAAPDASSAPQSTPVLRH